MRFSKTVFLVLMGVLIACTAFAQTTYYWDGGDGSDSNWENPDNWDPNGVPFTDDEAFILGSPFWGYVAIDSNQNVNSLLIDYGMELDIKSNADLTVHQNAYFGFDTDCFVDQSGGRVAVGNQLRLGDLNGSFGTYSLNAGELESREMVVGSEGTGSVYQYGGTNKVITGLVLGVASNSNGSYELDSWSEDAFLTVGHEVIASSSTGFEVEDSAGTWSPGAFFSQNDGMHEIIGDNAVYNEDEERWEVREGSFSDLVIGDVAGSHGAYYQYGGSLNSRTALLVDEFGEALLNDDGQQQYIGGNEIIGFQGNGTFVQDGGYNLLDGDLVLGADAGSRGEYYLYDGYLATNLNDDRSEVFIGSNGEGYFYQDGGEFNAENSGVYLGAGSTGHGIFEMADGEFRADGMALGEWAGTGEVIQSGGTVIMTDYPLWLARQDNSVGLYTLSGTGQLHVENSDLVVGNRGRGEFRQSGGEVNVNGNVWVSATPDGTSSGLYDLSGGTLNAGTINNYDRFYYRGGALNAAVANAPGSLLEMSGEGTRVIGGTVHNYGTVKAGDTAVQVNGELRNFNILESAQSAWYCQDLIVESAGYISAGVDDQFNVAGKFASYSTMNADWKTGSANLLFDNKAHEVVFNSQDLGPVETAYLNNFAWGNVDFGNGTFTLRSLDAEGTQYGALYVTTIAGIDYVIDDANLTYQVNNFTGNSNIYYNATANPWLQGKTYSFAGESLGKLRPVGVVPEPVATLLFLIGGGAMFVGGRMRGRS
ncbi:MAG TPA: hypothetical protein P5110_01170 [Candidatus Omnitrophota bacterium]|nr:hypothetical protein [Candidatus Omnitrophota bacterium]HRZ14096.1 hypothetical protein [Candidatus Omnitrophota bacterium]